MVRWTWLLAGSITVTLALRRLATQTSPPPPTTAAGSAPTMTAATAW
jgi:hypothetical protein